MDKENLMIDFEKLRKRYVQLMCAKGEFIYCMFYGFEPSMRDELESQMNTDLISAIQRKYRTQAEIEVLAEMEYELKKAKESPIETFQKRHDDLEDLHEWVECKLETETNDDIKSFYEDLKAQLEYMLGYDEKDEDYDDE